MEWEEFIKHFPPEVTEKEKEFVEEISLKHSRYLITRMIGKKQFAYCTHCHKEYMTKEHLKYNGIYECEKCGSSCTVKTEKKGTKHLYDEAYTLYYMKSQIAPKAIVARGIYSIRNYSENYRNVKTKNSMVAYYVFQQGGSTMYRTDMYHYEIYGNRWSWVKSMPKHQKSIASLADSTYANVDSYYNGDDLPDVVKGTQFQYSTWEQYSYGDMVKFFDLYSRYPSVEYLTKVGLKELIIDKLNGERTYQAINWRGKNLLKVLKLTKQELKEIKNSSVYVDFIFLNTYQQNKRKKLGLTLEEIATLSRIKDQYSWLLDEVIKYVTPKQLARYILKDNGGECYILRDYKDYLNDCKELGLNLNDEYVLFPKDLRQAHQNTIKQLKCKKNKALEELFIKRYKQLSKKYKFEFEGLEFRPPRCTQELIDEGEIQHICIGGYCKQYAEGKTDLMLIRRIAEPDKPFYAMEIKDGRIVQTRGLRNSTPKELEVLAMIEAFEERLKNKGKKKNEKEEMKWTA